MLFSEEIAHNQMKQEFLVAAVRQNLRQVSGSDFGFVWITIRLSVINLLNDHLLNNL